MDNIVLYVLKIELEFLSSYRHSIITLSTTTQMDESIYEKCKLSSINLLFSHFFFTIIHFFSFQTYLVSTDQRPMPGKLK